MKKIFHYSLMVAATILLASSTSCISSQSHFPVKGSGELTDKTYNITGFEGVDVSGGFDVNLVQGNSESVIISAQENLFEYITVKVENGVLKIKMEHNVIQTKGLKAKIYLKSINSLAVSGGGDVSAETPLDVPELAINLSGGGDIVTTLKTEELDCHISGGGDAEIGGAIANYRLNMSGGGDIQSEIAAQTISCTISGGGDVKLNNSSAATLADVNISGGGDLAMDVQADEIKCSVSGGGNATLNGSAKNLEVAVNGGGDINARSFKTEKATFRANGGSDVHISATSELSGQISGGGDVYYSGNPVVNIDAKGGSSVHKE
jgi:hypothetical protein